MNNDNHLNYTILFTQKLQKRKKNTFVLNNNIWTSGLQEY